MATQQLQQAEAYRSAVHARGEQSGTMETAVQAVEPNDLPEAGQFRGYVTNRDGSTGASRIE